MNYIKRPSIDSNYRPEGLLPKYLTKNKNASQPKNNYLKRENCTICDRHAKKWGKKCGVQEKSALLKDENALLIRAEEEMQKSYSNPIFHLYYYAPLRFSTTATLSNGVQCSDVVNNILGLTSTK